MKDNSTEFIKVTYFSNCLGDGKLRETNKCSGLRVGTRVTFTGKAFLCRFICTIGVKVQNMKMDFNTGGTWRQ